MALQWGHIVARRRFRGVGRHAAVTGGRSTHAVAALVSTSPWPASSVRLARHLDPLDT